MPRPHHASAGTQLPAPTCGSAALAVWHMLRCCPTQRRRAVAARTQCRRVICRCSRRRRRRRCRRLKVARPAGRGLLRHRKQLQLQVICVPRLPGQALVPAAGVKAARHSTQLPRGGLGGLGPARQCLGSGGPRGWRAAPADCRLRADGRRGCQRRLLLLVLLPGRRKCAPAGGPAGCTGRPGGCRQEASASMHVEHSSTRPASLPSSGRTWVDGAQQ